MKKLLLIIVIFSLCGCVNINKSNPDEIVETTINSKIKLSNQYRTGFKYYLPVNLNSIKSSKSNEVLTNGIEKYYLYVDLIRFYDGINYDFRVNDNAYYSRIFEHDNEKGYLEINVNNNKYLIEIIYNYAKIEVIVDKDKINEAVTNSIIILSSIQYNRDILANMLGEDILNYSEEKFSIFDTNVNDSNFLEYVQEYDNYNRETDLPDYDLIN